MFNYKTTLPRALIMRGLCFIDLGKVAGDAQARRGCCATVRCLTQIYSLYKRVPLAGFCFVFVDHVLVTRQHESGDIYTLFACSDPFSLYYVGHKGPPATHHPTEEFGLSMIMQY